MRKHLAMSVAVLASAGAMNATAAQDDWTIRAQEVHTAAASGTLENGTVRVQGGKIAAVGGGRGGGETLEVFAVTPGMVDLAVGIDLGNVSVEQSTETVFDHSVAGALDLFNYRWRRVLESGVTTVMASPPDFDVFGGFAVCLKTGGEATLTARMVKPEASLKAAIGGQPSSGNRPPRGSAPINFYYRRPTTRMGVEWHFRKAYYDTLAAHKRGGTQGTKEDARRDAVLGRTLSGDLPVAVKAMATQDVRTACFLKEEFGIPRMILMDAVEAWREPQLVARSGAAVCLPPFPASGRVPDGHLQDSYFLPLNAPKVLHDLGIPIALSAHDGAEVGNRLANQVGFAMRGGLSFDAALAAVTLQPARLVGIDDRVGSIEVGKDADLVLWSGPPFEPSSRIVGVLLDGRLVVDPRDKNE